jgi:hypothetical protein
VCTQDSTYRKSASRLIGVVGPWETEKRATSGKNISCNVKKRPVSECISPSILSGQISPRITTTRMGTGGAAMTNSCSRNVDAVVMMGDTASWRGILGAVAMRTGAG